MADYSQQIAAFNTSVQQRITGKNTVNSIDPVDVGGSITDLASFLLPIVNSINAFDILVGSVPPVNTQGNNDDIYFKGGNSIVIYRKQNGIWITKGTISLGINIVDGNISVQSSVNGMVVTSSSGQWGINNVIYTKALQTQFTVPTQHATLNRIDAVFANNVGSGGLYYQQGTAANTPVEPVPPSGSIVISYIYVPSLASNVLPYIANTNSGGNGATAKTTITGTNADISAFGSFGRLSTPYLIQSTPFIASFDLGGVITYIDPSMLDGGYLYGFPNPSNSFSFLITYL